MVFLNSLGTSSSSQMLVRSEWSASRATGPADLNISAGIPSIPGDFPELVCLIAFETSSIVGGGGRGVGGVGGIEVGDHGLLWDLLDGTVCW